MGTKPPVLSSFSRLNSLLRMVEAIEYVPRPQLLGLGATPMPEDLEEGRTRKRKVSRFAERDNVKLTLCGVG
jgi:hypothetical protein